MSDEQKKPKYKVGDYVEMFGSKAHVVQVHESQYFSNGTGIHFLYDIEFTDGNVQGGVMESALNPIKLASEWGTQMKRLCECGAWAVHWASQEHSDWCPAAWIQPFKDKK
jgi:hypothetical protein